eukprot:2445421-Alexandrium_andersonii.AAC.1
MRADDSTQGRAGVHVVAASTRATANHAQRCPCVRVACLGCWGNSFSRMVHRRMRNRNSSAWWMNTPMLQATRFLFKGWG